MPTAPPPLTPNPPPPPHFISNNLRRALIAGRQMKPLWLKNGPFTQPLTTSDSEPLSPSPPPLHPALHISSVIVRSHFLSKHLRPRSLFPTAPTPPPPSLQTPRPHPQCKNKSAQAPRVRGSSRSSRHGPGTEQRWPNTNWAPHPLVMTHFLQQSNTWKKRRKKKKEKSPPDVFPTASEALPLCEASPVSQCDTLHNASTLPVCLPPPPPPHRP